VLTVCGLRCGGRSCAGIAAVDVSTGFDVTRLAVRYGGPGAPTSAVLAFWPTAIAAAGIMSTLLTSVLNLEAFGLKAKCPECGTVNRAGFKGILGGTDSEISRVVRICIPFVALVATVVYCCCASFCCVVHLFVCACLNRW
jgi:hypothetical protein